MTTLIESLNGIAERVRHLEGTEDYDIGDGAPSHFAAEGRAYWDHTNDALYRNNDGLNGWTFIGGTVPPGVPHAILSLTHTDSTPAAVVRGDLITGQDTAGVTTWQRLGLGIGNAVLMSDGLDAYWGMLAPWNLPHELLSATHTDTVVNAVTRGSIVYGNVTPAWDELPVGGAHQLLKVNAGGTDPAWASFDWDEISAAAAADMVHDHSVALEGGEVPLASLGSYTRGDLIVGGLADWTDLAIGGAGTFLRSDGADPSWQALVVGDIPAHDLLSATHGDTVASVVTRGDLVVGTAGGWDDLAHPGGAGYALTTDANDVIWDQTPTWTGLHTFGAGWILSGGLADLAGIADALVLDDDGDTTISAPTDDQIDIEISGADDFTFTANSLNVLSGSGITMADDTWIGLGVAVGRIEFDITPAPDVIKVSTADFGVACSPAAARVEIEDGGTAHTVITKITQDDENTWGLSIGNDTWDTTDTNGLGLSVRNDGTGYIWMKGAAAEHLILQPAGFASASGCVGVGKSVGGAAPTARLDVIVDPTIALEVLKLEQNDTDDEFIHFQSTAAAGNLTRAIVNEGDQGGQTEEGWLKVLVTDVGDQIADQAYFIRIYTLSA